MKTLRFVVATAVALGSVSAFATNARVESMGKNSTFIMDDISIFDNPANMNLYPNFLIGEMGNYVSCADVKNVKPGENQDPCGPWFGGIFSLGIGAEKSVSIGGILNRKDERLFKFFPDVIRIGNTGIDKIERPEPVTNFDGFLGANLNNVAIGAHLYIAHQDGLDKNGFINGNAFVSALQGDLGTNIELSSNYALEVSGGFYRIQYGPSDRDFFDLDVWSTFGRARLFSRIEAINGHLIPAASVYLTNAPGRDEKDFNLGMGVDAAFDRGFFWMGFQGFYNEQRAGSTWTKDFMTGESEFHDPDNGDDAWGPSSDRTSLWQFGGTISFGIERNIWWDWFVIRVGGKKTIAYADYSHAKANERSVLCPTINTSGQSNSDIKCTESGNYFVTNKINDGSPDDNVGFGFGVNIEEKLKIDASVSEDLLFRNPFQGGGRLLSRISATYSF